MVQYCLWVWEGGGVLSSKRILIFFGIFFMSDGKVSVRWIIRLVQS